MRGAVALAAKVRGGGGAILYKNTLTPSLFQQPAATSVATFSSCLAWLPLGSWRWNPPRGTRGEGDGGAAWWEWGERKKRDENE